MIVTNRKTQIVLRIAHAQNPAPMLLAKIAGNVNSKSAKADDSIVGELANADLHSRVSADIS
jgi:hypothetical protein